MKPRRPPGARIHLRRNERLLAGAQFMEFSPHRLHELAAASVDEELVRPSATRRPRPAAAKRIVALGHVDVQEPVAIDVDQLQFVPHALPEGKIEKR